MLSTHLYARQPGVREGSGEERLPQIGFRDVKTHSHRWRIFLNVEPHLNKNSEKIKEAAATLKMKNESSYSLFTHVVSIDQRTNCFQRAEGVILSVVLTTAGVPDQVAALLVSQDVRCGSLKHGDIKNISAAAEGKKCYF